MFFESKKVRKKVVTKKTVVPTKVFSDFRIFFLPSILPDNAANESEKVKTNIPKTKASVFWGIHKKAISPNDMGVSHIP